VVPGGGRWLPLQHLDDQVNHRPNLVRFGWAAGHVVIHRHNLVQCFQHRVKAGWWIALRALVIRWLRQDLFGFSVVSVLIAVSKIFYWGLEVRQARDTAFAGARTEGHQDLRFAPQQVGHFFVLVVADAAVEQGQQDEIYLPSLRTSLYLASMATGQKTTSKLASTSRIFSWIFRDSDLATTARGSPIHGKFRFAVRAHASHLLSQG
jgi:hypothetical protein